MTPYESVWRAPAVAARWRGVTVWHTYKDDELNNGPETYYYTTNQEGQYDGETDDQYFDVREIATWVEPQHPPYLDSPERDTPENRLAWKVFQAKTEPTAIRKAIRAAIERGLLTQQGYRAPPPKRIPVLPPLPRPEVDA